MTFILRTETPPDHAAVRRVHEGAFATAAEAKLTDLLRMSNSFVPELSIVAEIDGELVGHVILTHATIEGRPDVTDFLVLGPIGVLPEKQKMGVGSALMNDALQRASSAGFRAVALIGHPTYYSRFGFLPGARFGLRSTYDVPEDVFMVCPLIENGLDAIRGTLLFPAEFGSV